MGTCNWSYSKDGTKKSRPGAMVGSASGGLSSSKIDMDDYKIDRSNMPTLEGSDKQKEWANDIINGIFDEYEKDQFWAITDYNKSVDNLASNGDNMAPDYYQKRLQGLPEQKERAVKTAERGRDKATEKAAVEAYKDFFAANNSASLIINNRQYINNKSGLISMKSLIEKINEYRPKVKAYNMTDREIARELLYTFSHPQTYGWKRGQSWRQPNKK